MLDLHALLLSTFTIARLKVSGLLLQGTLTVLQQAVNGQSPDQLSSSRCWTCALRTRPPLLLFLRPAATRLCVVAAALLLSTCTIARLKVPLLAGLLLHGTLTVLQSAVNGQAPSQLSSSRCQCWTCAPSY